MKISQINLALDNAWEVRRPLFFHSMPGLGKSTVVRKWAEDKGIGFIDFRASQKSPTEIGSVLYVEDGKSKFTEADWIPEDGQGVVLLDEMGDAPLMVQSALYEFTWDRRMGARVLGEGWIIVLAGNRQEDKAAAGRSSTAMNNRCIHITIEPDVDDLKTFAYQNGWNDAIPGYLSHRPDQVSTFDPKSKEFAFASPRTWEITSDILNSKPDPSIRFELLAGTIGSGPAGELEGFLRVRDELPNMKRILMNPDTEAIPTSPAGKWAVCGALAHLTDHENIGKILIYIDRMQDDNKSMFVRDILMKDESIMRNKQYIAWVAGQSDVYLDDPFAKM